MAIPHASNETSYLLPPNKEDWEGQGIPDFVYGQEELVMEGVQWPRGALSLLNTPPLSHFDSALCSASHQSLQREKFCFLG